MRARVASTALGLALLLGPACQSSPPPAPPPTPEPGERAAAFDAERAWKHLEALAEIGPRVAGTPGSERAREYIRGELEALGLELVEQPVQVNLGDDEQLKVHNVVALVPGASSDVFLLAAPYDSRRYDTFSFLGVNDGASGAAVLLEMARVLSRDPLPYTTAFAFLDGEAPRSPGEAGAAPRSHFGSRGLAQELAEEDLIDTVRLALVINRVCDPDLRVARDSGSHRNYREWIWDAALRLDRVEAFPQNAAFESIDEGHAPFAAAGIRRAVAVADTSFGGEEPPGPLAGTEDDDLEHCAAESLETVGVVTLDALDDIAGRLAKVDYFADAPVAGTKVLELRALADEGPPGGESAGAPEAAGGSAAESAGESAGAPEPEHAGAPSGTPVETP